MNTFAVQVAESQPANRAELDVETIVGQLDDETVRSLGLLHKAPRGIPELAIASFAYGSRLELEAYGLIESERRDDRTLEVTITQRGREVIAVCAERMPTLEGSDLAAAVERAGELLSLADNSAVRTARA
jgi:hypothetical protein